MEEKSSAGGRHGNALGTKRADSGHAESSARVGTGPGSTAYAWNEFDTRSQASGVLRGSRRYTGVLRSRGAGKWQGSIPGGVAAGRIGGGLLRLKVGSMPQVPTSWRRAARVARTI